MVFCFLKITNLYCVCVLLPTACIRRCVKEFILLAEIQGKWLKETHSAVQNIREKKPSFQTGLYFNIEIKSWHGMVEIIPVFCCDLVREGMFSKIELGQCQMICS